MRMRYCCLASACTRCRPRNPEPPKIVIRVSALDCAVICRFVPSAPCALAYPPPYPPPHAGEGREGGSGGIPDRPAAVQGARRPIQGNRIWNVLDISAACCGVKENRFYPHGVEARGWGMGWRHLRRVLKVLKIHGLVTPGGTICLKF